MCKSEETKGDAFNVTLSDETEKEEETPEEEKFIAFMPPYEENEDSQSYYYENSDEGVCRQPISFNT
jgi:hypothetical protein